MSLAALAYARRSWRVFGGAAFDPASLFASGENGVWYEPSTTTAFRSTTDLTPCAVGESCGFLLDKSQGAGYSGGSFTGLGSELVDLDNATVQATGDASGTYNASTKVFQCDGTGLSGQLRLNASIAASATKLYVVEVEFFGDFDLLSASGTFVDTGSRLDPTATGTGIIVTPGSNTFRIATFSANVAASITVSIASVRELPGNHATQGTAAARPILRQTGGGVDYLEDDEVDDALNWAAPADTDYTVAYVNSSGTVTILTGQSLSGATDILLDPALVAYIAVDRALTAEKTTGLTSYLEALA